MDSEALVPAVAAAVRTANDIGACSSVTCGVKDAAGAAASTGSEGLLVPGVAAAVMMASDIQSWQQRQRQQRNRISQAAATEGDEVLMPAAAAAAAAITATEVRPSSSACGSIKSRKQRQREVKKY